MHTKVTWTFDKSLKFKHGKSLKCYAFKIIRFSSMFIMNYFWHKLKEIVELYLVVSKSHFYKNTDEIWILQQTDYGDCWTLCRSLVYQLQWAENSIRTRHGFCNRNQWKDSYWVVIGRDITMNGYLQFVILDGYYDFNYIQDAFGWLFCATFLLTIIRPHFINCNEGKI